MNVLFFIFQVKMSTLVLFNLNYSVHMNSVHTNILRIFHNLTQFLINQTPFVQIAVGICIPKDRLLVGQSTNIGCTEVHNLMSPFFSVSKMFKSHFAKFHSGWKSQSNLGCAKNFTYSHSSQCYTREKSEAYLFQ